MRMLNFDWSGLTEWPGLLFSHLFEPEQIPKQFDPLTALTAALFDVRFVDFPNAGTYIQ